MSIINLVSVLFFIGLLPRGEPSRRASPIRRWIFGDSTFNSRPAVGSSITRSYSKSILLSHLDEQGRPSMVDVGNKPSTRRTATATGRILIPELAFDLVTSSYPVEDDVFAVRPGAARTAFEKARRKGDALTIAQLAAIMGAKQTSALIPLCHPVPLTNVDVKLVPETQRSQEDSTSTSDNCGEGRGYSIRCTATVTCEGRTGVEMEALTAVTIGLLTVWDMLKAVAGKEMEIRGIMVVRKSGGRSGDFERPSVS